MGLMASYKNEMNSKMKPALMIPLPRATRGAVVWTEQVDRTNVRQNMSDFLVRLYRRSVSRSMSAGCGQEEVRLMIPCSISGNGHPFLYRSVA
jgi:hypothetical protein